MNRTSSNILQSNKLYTIDVDEILETTKQESEKRKRQQKNQLVRENSRSKLKSQNSNSANNSSIDDNEDQRFKTLDNNDETVIITNTAITSLFKNDVDNEEPNLQECETTIVKNDFGTINLQDRGVNMSKLQTFSEAIGVESVDQKASRIAHESTSTEQQQQQQQQKIDENTEPPPPLSLDHVYQYQNSQRLQQHQRSLNETTIDNRTLDQLENVEEKYHHGSKDKRLNAKTKFFNRVRKSKKAVSVLQMLKITFTNKNLYKISAFNIILLPVRLIFRHLDATFPKYVLRTLGDSVSFGIIFSFIFIFLFLIHYLLKF